MKVGAAPYLPLGPESSRNQTLATRSPTLARSSGASSTRRTKRASTEIPNAQRCGEGQHRRRDRRPRPGMFKVVANHAVEDRALGGPRAIRAGVDGCRIGEKLSDRNAARALDR